MARMQTTKNKRRQSNGTDDRSNWSNVNDVGEFSAPKGHLQQSQSNRSKIRGPPSDDLGALLLIPIMVFLLVIMGAI